MGGGDGDGVVAYLDLSGHEDGVLGPRDVTHVLEYFLYRRRYAEVSLFC